MSGTDHIYDGDTFSIEEASSLLVEGQGHTRHPHAPGPSGTPPEAVPRVTVREIPGWRNVRRNQLRA